MKEDMAVVGPRPPLPSQGELYPAHVRRRSWSSLDSPGRGRSLARPTYPERTRSDMDNWSLAGDLVIVLRTLRAEAHGHTEPNPRAW
jgi:lipopolysaccharide/colanic/teichoic acid biosynthesis glycosyltransferase